MNSPYSPEERLRIYEKVLESYSDLFSHFICVKLIIATGGDDRYKGMETSFPELWNQKPKKCFRSGIWWDTNDLGYLQRVVAVLKAIEDVKKLIKK